MSMRSTHHHEHELLGEALKAVTTRAPLITRGIINASKTSHLLSHRRQQLAFAINQAEALLAELKGRQSALRWQHEDVA